MRAIRKHLSGILTLFVVSLFTAFTLWAATGDFAMPISSGTGTGDLLTTYDNYIFNVAAGAEHTIVQYVSATGPFGATVTIPYPTASPHGLTSFNSQKFYTTPVTLSPTGTSTYTASVGAYSLVYLNNASNFEIQLGSTGGVTDGQDLEIVNISTGTAGFSDIAGVQDLSAVVMTRNDVAHFRWVVDSWSGGAGHWVMTGFQNHN